MASSIAIKQKLAGWRAAGGILIAVVAGITACRERNLSPAPAESSFGPTASAPQPPPAGPSEASKPARQAQQDREKRCQLLRECLLPPPRTKLSPEDIVGRGGSRLDGGHDDGADYHAPGPASVSPVTQAAWSYEWTSIPAAASIAVATGV